MKKARRDGRIHRQGPVKFNFETVTKFHFFASIKTQKQQLFHNVNFNVKISPRFGLQIRGYACAKYATNWEEKNWELCVVICILWFCE